MPNPTNPVGGGAEIRQPLPGYPDQGRSPAERPRWASNVLHSVQSDVSEVRKRIVDSNTKKLQALWQAPECRELVAAIDARDGGFFQSLRSMFGGRIGGVPLTREIALTKSGFFYISESVKYSSLLPLPEELMASPALFDTIVTGMDSVLRALRQSGSINVRLDFKDNTVP